MLGHGNTQRRLVDVIACDGSRGAIMSVVLSR